MRSSMMLRVEQLSFRYPGSAIPTLHELAFCVQPGEIFGFLGPSGAGVFDRINGSHPSQKRIAETGATEPTFCYC
jgi:ABC-type glutathione transport system ATPase component